MSINECSFTSFHGQTHGHGQTQDQIEALALLDRLFGPSPSSSSSKSSSSSPIEELASWRDLHHHRSSSLESTTSSSGDSYWSGPFLSVPETPIDRVEEYPFDLREAPPCIGDRDHVEYRGPRITISPSHSHSPVEVGGVIVGAGGEYRSRGGSSVKKGMGMGDSSNSGSNKMPEITVEFAD